ncbi:MAG: hypothetical protein WC554_11995 [Clostridia bacterium]
MGLFFKDNPELDAKKTAEKDAKKASKSVTKTASSIPQPIQPVQITSQIVSNLTGVADEKFVEMLMDVIAKNNIPGQDYFEFKQTLDAMNSLPGDEKTKFLTIYTMFQLQGCKKETLLSSIDKYVSVVKAEEVNFDIELESQKNISVTTPLAQIEEARKKLDELNKQISELNTFIITSSQEVQNSELKLQMTETNFKKSIEKVVGLLLADKDKINSYIQ